MILKSRAYKRNNGANGYIDYKVNYMRFFVISKHMRPHYSFKLRIKMREKVRMAEKEPVKENYIVNFHTIKHGNKPYKKLKKPKTVFDTVPHADKGCSQKQQNRNSLYNPTDNVCAGKTLFFIRNCSQVFFRRR